MNVFALDLSLTSTGVAHVDGRLELLRVKADTNVKRRALIADAVADAAYDARHAGDGLDLVVIESLPSGHAYSIGALARLHGVVLDRLDDEYEILWVTPDQRAGWATRNPKAKKQDVTAAAVDAGAPIPDKPKAGRDDLADAFWLRSIGLASLGEWVVEETPHRRALVDRLTGVAA